MLLEDLGVRCPDKTDSEGHDACGRVTEHVPRESIFSETAFLTVRRGKGRKKRVFVCELIGFRKLIL